MAPRAPLVLALDAMGVIYRVGDDVADLLCPFVQEKRGRLNRQRIQELYAAASLGRMAPDDFWHAVGLTPELEDEYLARYERTEGIDHFLRAGSELGLRLWCVSNDLSRWSMKLRQRLGVEPHFRGFVISGDIGARKPDPAIYRHLLMQAAVPADQVLFVDDRVRNLEAARELGMQTVLFAPDRTASYPQAVRSLEELESLLRMTRR